ncbi:MAG: hypothetical protein JRJ76_03620 [Deltaproteobacteria bacterium]|nr:hypothetical protein [Deltaproteobacteria bacterium]
MDELNDITEQILYNCDITDAKYAGIYSICNLALRLRDLFKWENKLDPWIEKNPAEVLEWIGNKEKRWEELADKDYININIQGKEYDPFDTKNINAILEPYDLLYGAGYALSLKPTFFLADLEQKKAAHGCNVYFLGRELARDLFTCPAQSVSNHILIRKVSAKAIFWDQIFYITKSGKNALRFALEEYGLNLNDHEILHQHLDRITTNEIETYLYHELGEIKDTVFDHNVWTEIIASFPHSPVELLVRTVKDLLANTSQHGILNYMITEQRSASLGFYVAFMDSLTKKLFPEILKAFETFTQDQNWECVKKAMAAGYATARRYTESICSFFEEGKQKDNKKWAETALTKHLIEPLCA